MCHVPCVTGEQWCGYWGQSRVTVGNGLGEGQPGAAGEQVVQALETTMSGMFWEEWGATGKGEKRNPLLKASTGLFSGCFLSTSRGLDTVPGVVWR